MLSHPQMTFPLRALTHHTRTRTSVSPPPSPSDPYHRKVKVKPSLFTSAGPARPSLSRSRAEPTGWYTRCWHRLSDTLNRVCPAAKQYHAIESGKANLFVRELYDGDGRPMAAIRFQCTSPIFATLPRPVPHPRTLHKPHLCNVAKARATPSHPWSWL
jgi:hypothetical protein